MDLLRRLFFAIQEIEQKQRPRTRKKRWLVSCFGCGSGHCPLFCIIRNCAKHSATDGKETMIGIMFRMWERALPAFCAQLCVRAA